MSACKYPNCTCWPSCELEDTMSVGAAGSVARMVNPNAGPNAADPKELQNDGDPIRDEAEVWPYCSNCGCRHRSNEHCPPPDEAAKRRNTQIMGS